MHAVQKIHRTYGLRSIGTYRTTMLRHCGTSRQECGSSPPQKAAVTKRARLGFAQPDGAVAGVDGDCLAAAIHFAVDLRDAERALDGHRNTEADVAIVRAGVDVGLQVAGQRDVHAAIAGVNGPARGDFRAGSGMGVDSAIACLDVERIEAAIEGDVAVAGGGLDAAIEAAGFDMAVAGAQLDIALGALQGDAAIAGIDIDAAGYLVGAH